MLKQIDFLYHFTRDLETLKEIFKHGFKPSYAKEQLADINILVPMVSFSNILLRDVGEDEVLNYGDYAIALTREWGIGNQVNPVVYTYEKGMLYNALNTFLHNSIFLSRIQEYKDYFKKFSDCKCGPFSKLIYLTNTSKEVMDILDYLSIKYDEHLVEILSNHAKTIHETNFPIITLTKPYKVVSSKGKEFIAYNDREWRKLYSDLKVIFESDPEYDKWVSSKKPHFNDEPYLLKFGMEDVMAILVKETDEIPKVIHELKSIPNFSEIDKLIANNSIIIGTKDQLEAANF